MDVQKLLQCPIKPQAIEKHFQTISGTTMFWSCILVLNHKGLSWVQPFKHKRT